MQKLEAAPLVKKVFGGFCKALFSSLLEDEPLKLGDDRSKKYARSLLESKENASIFTSAFVNYCCIRMRNRVAIYLLNRKG